MEGYITYSTSEEKETVPYVRTLMNLDNIMK